MSASIGGGFPLRSAVTPGQNKKGRRRPSMTSGLSISSPDVPQLHSMPTRAQSPETHPPQGTPTSAPHHDPPRPHHHLHHHSGFSLHPLTPLSAAASPTATSSHSSNSSSGLAGPSYSSLHGSGPGPSASSLSLTSVDSASTTFTTATGVSRASSTRSTSSVQAVPMRKPQRTPAVPRIVTRGINALSAYGVGMTSANAAGAPPPISPTWEKGKAPASAIDEDGESFETGSQAGGRPSMSTSPTSPTRPNVFQRSSWRRRVGSGGTLQPGGRPSADELRSKGGGGQPSPVNEDGSPSTQHASSPSRPAIAGRGASAASSYSSASSTSPGGPGSGAQAPLDPWRVLERPGEEVGSVGGSSRSRSRPANEMLRSPASWERPRRPERSESSGGGGGRAREEGAGSPSPARASAAAPQGGREDPRDGDRGRTRASGTGHERDMSHASNATASTTTPGSPMRSQDRGSDPAVAAAEQQGSLIGMTPNAMGVVGNRRTTEDFEFGEVLGEGSYSTVTLVRTVHPPYRQYALKVLDKEHIKRERKTKYVLIERDTLKALDGHPGIIKLWWTFQDEWSLYYVLEFAENGELLKWIKQYGSFDLRSARFYVSQVLSAVEYMHEKGVIHRDLKPENILFDRNMRVKITDFGTAKLLKQNEMKDGHPLDDPQGRPRARSFVGTPEYVSPEILSEGRESSFSSDFWALGCVLYQVLAGRPPFQARTEYLMFQKIINLEYDFPPGFPPHARDLIEKLLVVDPRARLGGDPASGNGIEAIKSHPFFTERLRPDVFPSTPMSVDQPGEADLPSPDLFSPTTEANDAASDALSSSLSDLQLSSPGPPRSRKSSRSSLDDPVDWVKIWEVEPPQIETGLCPPAPVRSGQFVLLDDGQSSIAPSTTETGLTSGHFDSQVVGGEESTRTRRSLISDSNAPDSNASPRPASPMTSGCLSSQVIGEEESGGTRSLIEDPNAKGFDLPAPSEAPVEEEDEEDEDLEDLDVVATSPISTSGRDLPPAASFGAGKWSDLLYPTETIIMLSPILQRPSSSAAAARTAILGRGQRIKSLNPLNLISSTSLAAAASPNGSPQAANVPLPSTPPPTSSSMSASSSFMGAAASPPLANGNSSVHSSAASGGSTSPLPSPPLPPAQSSSGYKARTLILTDHPRLLCIKEAPDRISIKSEVFLGGNVVKSAQPRREGTSVFLGVEASSKDPNVFTVKTSARTFKYEEPFGHAARWIRELRETYQTALATQQSRRS